MGRHAIHKLDQHYASIINMYTVLGYSLRQIGKKFNAPPETIRRILKRNGYKTRSRTDAMYLWHTQNSIKK